MALRSAHFQGFIFGIVIFIPPLRRRFLSFASFLALLLYSFGSSRRKSLGSRFNFLFSPLNTQVIHAGSQGERLPPLWICCQYPVHLFRTWQLTQFHLRVRILCPLEDLVVSFSISKPERLGKTVSWGRTLVSRRFDFVCPAIARSPYIFL